jgi:hypothetical protein
LPRSYATRNFGNGGANVNTALYNIAPAAVVDDYIVKMNDIIGKWRLMLNGFASPGNENYANMPWLSATQVKSPTVGSTQRAEYGGLAMLA